jgi:hypothetical protein
MVIAVTPIAPPELQARAAEWEDLSRWERAELGRALRRLGWSYGEIRTVIPVPKGTLAGWCRDIVLSADQVVEIRRRTGQVKGVPRNTQWRRRREITEIRAEATAEMNDLAEDSLWMAGTSSIGEKVRRPQGDSSLPTLTQACSTYSSPGPFGFMLPTHSLSWPSTSMPRTTRAGLGTPGLIYFNSTSRSSRRRS